MSLLQEEFAQAAARLIQKAAELGYGVTLGDAFRSPEQAMQNAANHVGVANSLHCDRLALDINLFKEGAYITDDTGHRELGQDDEVCASALRLANGGCELGDVAVEIAYHDVHLCEREPHAPILALASATG